LIGKKERHGLVSDEVERLKHAPSTATVLLGELSSALQLLRPLWTQDASVPLSQDVRTRLSVLSKSLTSVLAVCVGRPPVPASLVEADSAVRATESRLRELAFTDEQLVGKLQVAKASIATGRKLLNALQRWEPFLAAKVPSKASQLEK